ncbi:hypothetical protein FGO68_gene4864 [Halteria grandinella]|uniref:Uncharacterized protein n=1 Tax=Halteria grandinella TaxID=5974 RepID=A0A8J8NMW9_HALGN|nr:hypothetical protein FGO68_gene4864 [Halteria grandinella]
MHLNCYKSVHNFPPQLILILDNPIAPDHKPLLFIMGGIHYPSIAIAFKEVELQVVPHLEIIHFVIFILGSALTLAGVEEESALFSDLRE